MLHRVPTTLALLLALVVAPRLAYAFTSTEIGFRKLLRASVLKLAATVLKEQARCHRARMMGDATVAPTVDCNYPAELPPSSQSKITKIQDTLAILADAKCTAASITPAALGYVACSAPCDTIDLLATD